LADNLHRRNAVWEHFGQDALNESFRDTATYAIALAIATGLSWCATTRCGHRIAVPNGSKSALISSDSRRFAALIFCVEEFGYFAQQGS
jgi:hypothetical protein